MNHGVHKCYAEEIETAIREQKDSWQLDGQNRYVDSYSYPIEYSAATGRVFVHLFDKGPHATTADGEVSKSFLYPSGQPLSHKVTLSSMEDEEAVCNTFAGSPHTVQLLQCGQKGLLFEYMNGGDLSQLPTELRTAAVVKQVIQAVAAIHEKGMVYRDLRPGNILFNRAEDGTVTVKISNLKSAAKVGQRDEMYGFVSYRSVSLLEKRVRQIYDRISHYVPDVKDDLWALGVTIYEVIHGGQPPFCAKIQDLFLNSHTREQKQKGIVEVTSEINSFCENTLVQHGLDGIVHDLLTGKVKSAQELLDNPIFRT